MNIYLVSNETSNTIFTKAPPLIDHTCTYYKMSHAIKLDDKIWGPRN